MRVRSLYALLGYKVDKKGAKEFNSILKRMRFDLIAISALWAGATASLGLFLREAGKMEQVNVAFETMLGGVKLSKKLLADLFEFARVTPFRIPGVLSTTRILLGMGVSSDKMVETLTNLGNVAAGLSVPLEQIALSYGKVAAAGYLTGYELQNLRRAGVPLVRELSKILGLGREEIQSMVRKRQISFELFEQAFKNMSEKGGTFHDLMKRQAKTLFGVISNIQDGLQIIAIRIGEGLLPQAKKLAEMFLTFLDTNKKIIKLRMIKFLSAVGKVLYRVTVELGKVIRSAFGIIDNLVGVERILKTIFWTLGAIIGLEILFLIGKLTTAMFTFGNVATMANIKAAAIPIAIGAAVLLALALFEDVYKWLKGEKGTTVMEHLDEKWFGGKLRQRILDTWESFKTLKRWIDASVQDFYGWIDSIYQKVKSTIDRIRPYLEALGLMVTGIITLDPKAISQGYSLFKTILKERAAVLNKNGQSAITENDIGMAGRLRNYINRPQTMADRVERVKEVGRFGRDLYNWMGIPGFMSMFGRGIRSLDVWTPTAGYYKGKLQQKYDPKYSPLGGNASMYRPTIQGADTGVYSHGHSPVSITINASNADARETAEILKSELGAVEEQQRQERVNAVNAYGVKSN